MHTSIKSISPTTADKQHGAGADKVASIRSWIETKLSESNDQAIYKYLSNLPPSQIAKGYEQLRSLVERQEIRIGNSTFTARFIAIPIVVKSGFPIQKTEDFCVDVGQILASIEKFGLRGKREGLVLMDTLVGDLHPDVFTMSGLYNQAQSIMLSSVAGQRSFGLDAGDITSVQTASGFTTLGYVLGVAYWKQGKETPKVINASDLEYRQWQAYVSHLIAFQMNPATCEGQQSLTVMVDRPQPIFAAFDSGRWAMTRSVIDTLIQEYRDMGVSVKVSLQIASVPLSSARNRVAITLQDNDDPASSMAYEVTLDEVKGMNLATFMRRCSDFLNARKVVVGTTTFDPSHVGLH